ncbi:MAG: hypothetical protein MJ105_02430 [Lachnospiraceae bacterium]|nr:hypothetical protein [Lachnospiraceae bacterium]
MDYRKLFSLFTTMPFEDGSMIGKLMFTETDKEEGVEVTTKNQLFTKVEVRREGMLAEITLLKPTGDPTAAPAKTVTFAEELAKVSFNPQEIIAFVESMNDPNTIHRGEHPIVPGLEMAEFFLQWLNENEPSTLKENMVDIRLTAPAFGDEELTLCRDSATSYGMVRNGELLWKARIIKK